MGKIEDLPRDMNRDLVSIIIPCYRQAHFLPAAIECALAQSYGAVEIIVVNDGSDDGTEEVASRYGERIAYVAKQNGGLPSARNAGIRQSHGEWLFFLDADDLIHPDAITWLVKAAAGRNGCVAQMGWRRFASDPQEEPFLIKFRQRSLNRCPGCCMRTWARSIRFCRPGKWSWTRERSRKPSGASKTGTFGRGWRWPVLNSRPFAGLERITARRPARWSGSAT